jgi:bifunctional DNA-binding transcriptional regulator/antitoxin component of YhaV-PrlF toxin-antitoxin module
MARRPLKQRKIRNIQRSKGSYYVTIPVELIREFKWRERQKVVVTKIGKNRIVIADWPAPRGKKK